MNRRLLALWSLVFLFSTLLTAQTAKPGWTKYIINNGEVTLSLPNSMKVYKYKDDGFALSKNGDGSYSVSSKEHVLFVPVSDMTDYDKAEEVGINNMMLVKISDKDDGLSKAIRMMKNSGLLRSIANLGLKSGIGMKRSGKDNFQVTKSGNLVLTKVAGKDALTMDMSFKEKSGKEADSEIYMIESGKKGILIVFANQKGLAGFTKQDNKEVLKSMRLK